MIEKLLIDENNKHRKSEDVRESINKLKSKIENSEIILDMFFKNSLSMILLVQIHFP